MQDLLAVRLTSLHSASLSALPTLSPVALRDPALVTAQLALPGVKNLRPRFVLPATSHAAHWLLYSLIVIWAVNFELAVSMRQASRLQMRG